MPPLPPVWWDVVQTTPAGQGLMHGDWASIPVPSLCYSEPRIREIIADLKILCGGSPEVRIAYAIKACALMPMLQVVAEEGLSAEIQSWHEAELAMAAGIDPSALIWNGPRKDLASLQRAVAAGITVIVDSVSEGLDLLRILREAPRPASGVQPNWGVRVALEHSVVASRFTSRGDKLGLGMKDTIELVQFALDQRTTPSILHGHGVARLSNLEEYASYVESMVRVYEEVAEETGLSLPTLDLGGGWETPSALSEHGCDSATLVEVASATLRRSRHAANVKSLVFEPGRHVVEDAAFALARITRKKEVGGRRWLIVDVSTNLLIPLPLARYRAVRASTSFGQTTSFGDGTCSPNGVLALDALYGEAEEGEVVVLSHCGAYSAALAEPFYEPPAPIYWCREDRSDPVVSTKQMKLAAALMQGFSDNMAGER